jgi:hypothetical protein
MKSVFGGRLAEDAGRVEEEAVRQRRQILSVRQRQVRRLHDELRQRRGVDAAAGPSHLAARADHWHHLMTART